VSREGNEVFEGVFTSLPSEPSRENPWFGGEGVKSSFFAADCTDKAGWRKSFGTAKFAKDREGGRNLINHRDTEARRRGFVSQEEAEIAEVWVWKS
jgi:hypothetical protein